MLSNIVHVIVHVIFHLEPVLDGGAIVPVLDFPIQCLARTRTIIDGAADGAPPELVPSGFRPSAGGVRTHPEPGIRRLKTKPFNKEFVRRMGFLRRYITAEIAEKRAYSASPQSPSGGLDRCVAPGARTVAQIFQPELRLIADVATTTGFHADVEIMGGEKGSELPGVGLNEEAPSLGDVFSNTVAILEAMAELP